MLPVMETVASRRQRGKALRATDLPGEVWVAIAKHLPFHERLALALVCKRLHHATRIQGAALWRALPVSFYGRAALHSFQSWRERCICSPAMLMLQQREEPIHDAGEEEEPAQWEDVVQAYRCVAPSLFSLLIRFEGVITTGEWLLEAEQLQDLALYGHSVLLTDALGMMVQLRELNLESAEEMYMESSYSLPFGLTKLLAVDCQLDEVPAGVSRMEQLESLYLSRNVLRPSSLAALAGLPCLAFLSLISCGLERPPRELSALTALRACYLDYNSLGSEESSQQLQEDFSAALTPHTGLEVLGMSHLYLDTFPDVLAALPSLKVLYLERNPGMMRLPSSAVAVLARLRVLSCDCAVLFNNAAMFRGAARLQHLLLSGSGLMCQALAAPVAEVLNVLSTLPQLQRVTFVVQTQCEDVASVEVAQLMLRFAGACPKLSVDVLDSEQFFGLSLGALDALK